MASKILIIDDDQKLSGLVAFNLRDLGFEVTTASSSESGLRLALSDDPSLVILDLMLPGMNGFEVCKRLRQNKPNLPIIILSCCSGESDKVLGLELGADDYVTKPFSMRELMARVQAKLRTTSPRASTSAKFETLQLGALCIDFVRRKVTHDGNMVNLTATEYDLLSFLVENNGKPFSRGELLSSVWGYSYDGYEHTVNTHINRLREKIEPDPSKPTYILTVRGVGYRCAEASELGPERMRCSG